MKERAKESDPALPSGEPATERRRLGRLVVGSAAVLLAVAGVGVATERAARTPIVRVGQRAPDFTLPTTDGGSFTLSTAAGRPIVLAFLPSVVCDFCGAQLRALQEIAPGLKAPGVDLYAITVDTDEIQRDAAKKLGLTFPMLTGQPTVGQHPAGTAYGLYHSPRHNAGPVNTNALVVVGRGQIVRAVHVSPGRLVPTEKIRATIETGLARQVRRRWVTRGGSVPFHVLAARVMPWLAGGDRGAKSRRAGGLSVAWKMRVRRHVFPLTLSGTGVPRLSNAFSRFSNEIRGSRSAQHRHAGSCDGAHYPAAQEDDGAPAVRYDWNGR